jgi:hypothetical protein
VSWADRTRPSIEALMVTVVLALTVLPEIGKVCCVAPGTNVTLVGTVATPGLLLAS